MTDIQKAIAMIQKLLRSGLCMQDAAIRLRVYEPDLVDRVLDEIGCWPSSEPELYALQRLS